MEGETGDMVSRTILIGVVAIVIIIIGIIGAFQFFMGPQIQPTPTPTKVVETPTTPEATTPITEGVRPNTPEDTLVIAMDISDAVSMDPARAYEFTSVLVVNQVYDKLVDFELPDLTRVVPEVAERWEVMPDNKTWIFYIRKGIKFANGDPLDADAVVFSLQRVLKLKQTASWVLAQFISSPEQIQKVDDYTVKIVLDKPVAPSFFLATLAFTTSAIVNPNEVLANEKDGDLGSAWLTDHSAGSGPYILERWVRDQEIVLVANENYWKGPPKIKRIILKHVPEPGNQLLLLRKGDVDIAWDLTVDQLEQLKGVKGIKISRIESLLIAYIGMNVKFEPLSKEEVRDAIRYCIDYDAIINDILKGGAIKWQTVIPKGLLGANPATPYKKDVAKAKELLAKAGYPDGFEVELATPPNPPDIDIATKIQADLAECGINVKIVQMVPAEMYEKYRKQGLQLVLARWGSDYPDPDNNAKAFGNYRVKQLAWRNVWYDDYAADLVEKGAVEFDPKKREEIYRELTEYILDKGPYAVLYQLYNQIAHGEWVKGFIPDPTFFLTDFSKVYKEI